MSHFLIVYDLTEKADNISLSKALRDKGAIEIMKSVWVIKADGRSDALRESIAPYLGSSGRALVTRLSGDIAFRNLLTGNKRSAFLGPT